MGVWKGPDYVPGQPLGGELGRALAAILATKQRPTLKAWMNARGRGLQVGHIECPKCFQENADMDQLATCDHVWHVCEQCSHKFRSGRGAIVASPLPADAELNAQVLEYLGEMADL